jgi:hypothetical protein
MNIQKLFCWECFFLIRIIVQSEIFLFSLLQTASLDVQKFLLSLFLPVLAFKSPMYRLGLLAFH